MVDNNVIQRFMSVEEASKAKEPAVKNPADALTSKETFLQLLVAQIKNQNPMQPQDGMQFVAQLAQFSGLEQTIEMRKELEAIHQTLQTKPAETDAAGKTEEGN